MSETYKVVRQNRYWHVLGDGYCGSLDTDEVEAHLTREGSWDELSAEIERDSAMKCNDCEFPGE